MMPRILMVASEAAPFAKTGGLADVAGALPPALAGLGHQVALVMPRYGAIGLEQASRVWDELPVTLGPHTFRCSIFARTHNGVGFFLVDCPYLYGRPGLYNQDGRDYPDNHLRFATLAIAALGVARHLFRPHVLHLHDWQAALAAVYLRTRFRLDPAFLGVKSVLTIHNLEHQGRFAPFEFAELGLDRSLLHPGFLEFHGDVNFLKGGIVFSDAITTVSPSYAREIQTPEFGFGLDGLLRAHAHRLTGILNGADYSQWCPQTDPHLAANYSPDNLEGKRVAKRDLLDAMGLPPENMDRPVLGIVSRLASQKGFQMLADIAEDLLREDLSLAVLGSGEARYEDLFRALQASSPGRVAVRIGYDNELAHKIEGGADMFLMPSLFEPCGLNQIYSLRYGTIPIVRATGGLDDSVEPDTGFKFQGFDPLALLGQIRLAVAEWRTPAAWRRRMLRAMAKDFSWNASASRYSELYASLAA